MSDLDDTIHTATARGVEACVARRARVLAHPDIAAALTRRPLSYAKPEDWNGYVPPSTWRERRNDSPQRVALIELCNAVAEREQEGVG